MISGCKDFYRVAHGEILNKLTTFVSDHGQIVFEGNFSFACSGKILSPLNRNRFTPFKEMLQDWSPSTFPGDHESHVSLSREKEDTTVDELIAVISAEDQGTTLWNVVLTQNCDIPKELVHREFHAKPRKGIKTNRWRGLLVRNTCLIDFYRSCRRRFVLIA